VTTSICGNCCLAVSTHFVAGTVESHFSKRLQIRDRPNGAVIVAEQKEARHYHQQDHRSFQIQAAESKESDLLPHVIHNCDTNLLQYRVGPVSGLCQKAILAGTLLLKLLVYIHWTSPGAASMWTSVDQQESRLVISEKRRKNVTKTLDIQVGGREEK